MTNKEDELELFYAEEITEEFDKFGRIIQTYKWKKAVKEVSLGSLSKPSNVIQIMWRPKKRFSYGE